MMLMLVGHQLQAAKMPPISPLGMQAPQATSYFQEQSAATPTPQAILTQSHQHL
jgi:hypothetical protein